MNLKNIKPSDIINKLKENDVNLPCHRCGSENFDFVSTTIVPINQNPNVLSVGGSAIPSAIIACSKCGVLSTHALAPLGLLESEEK